MWEEQPTDLSTRQKPSTRREQTVYLVIAVRIGSSCDVYNSLSMMTGVILYMGRLSTDII